MLTNDASIPAPVSAPVMTSRGTPYVQPANTVSMQTYFELEIVALCVSFLAAFFIALLVFRKVWKSNATTLKLFGFVVTFIISFMLIDYVITMMLPSVAFSR